MSQKRREQMVGTSAGTAIDTASIAARLEAVRTQAGFGDLMAFWKELGGEKVASYGAARTWHRGERPAPADYLAAVSRRFGVSLAWLITGEEPAARAEALGFAKQVMEHVAPGIELLGAVRDGIERFVLDCRRWRPDLLDGDARQVGADVAAAFAKPIAVATRDATYGEKLAALHATLAQLYIEHFGSATREPESSLQGTLFDVTTGQLTDRARPPAGTTWQVAEGYFEGVEQMEMVRQLHEQYGDCEVTFEADEREPGRYRVLITMPEEEEEVKNAKA